MISADVVAVALAIVFPPLLVTLLVLAIVAVVRLPVGTVRTVLAVVSVAFVVVMFAAIVSVAWWWGIGYDYAERPTTVPASVDNAMVWSAWIAVAAYSATLLVGLQAFWQQRRLPTPGRP